MRIIMYVRYKDGAISEVQYRDKYKDPETIGESKKSDVINDIINKGLIYKTADQNCVVNDVHVVSGKYIRTDGNETEEDNLGELPEF